MRRARRRFTRHLLESAALAAAAAALPAGLRPPSAAAQGRPSGADSTGAGNDKLILLGTQGGPNYTPERGETSSVLVVDDVPYLIDCGYGTLGALIEAGISYLKVPHIFLTHLHDDHTSDIAALLSHQWTSGRVEPTVVHGPYGTRALVEAAVAFGAANAAIRLVDEARSVKPEDLFSGAEIAASRSSAKVFENEHLTVSAIENTHYPQSAREQMQHRSVAYRLDTASRSIVFSGDTAYSEELVTLARAADLLVCETIDVAAMRRSFEAMVARGQYADNPEGIWHHIVSTHTSTEDAGRMASEAGVATLVLNHIVPGALGDLSDADYIAGVRKTFDGEVIVGRDFMAL